MTQINGRERRDEPPAAKGRDTTTLAPRARQLFDDMLALCDARLEPLVRGVLDQAVDGLFRQADQSFSNTEQQSLLESMREIQRGRANVAPRFLSGLGPEIEAETGPQALEEATFESLELVDPEAFEADVLLDDISARLASRSSLPLFELGYRVAVLHASPFLTPEQLPFGPRALTRAFADATEQLDLHPSGRRFLYRTLEKQLDGVLRTLYEDINALLLRERILSHLHVPAPRRQASAPGSAHPTDRADNEVEVAADMPDAPEAAAAESPAAEPGPAAADPAAAPLPLGRDTDSYTAMFGVLSDLLAKRRATLGIDEIRSGREVPEPQVLDVLRELQTRTPAPIIVDGKPVPRSMKHVRQDLMAQLRRFGDGTTPPQLSTEQDNALDLVSMLFDHLDGQLVPGGSAQSLLTRLQVPMLRVAMSDHAFFSQHEHPARQLLDSITEAANQWLDEDDPDPTLSKRLRAVVHRVANEFDGDTRVFEEARHDIDEYVSTLSHRATMAEKRHVEAARGRERLELARNRAREIIDQRVAEGEAPELVNAMLEQAWTDVLSLTILRWGERSDAFRRRMRVTDQLLRFTHQQATDRERTELRAEVQSGLDQVGIQGEEASHLLQRITPETPGAAPGPGAPSDAELTHRLRKRPASSRATGAISRSPGSAPLDKDGQAALDRILELPYGSSLLEIRADGKRARRRLAWYSPRTGRCLLLNQHGGRCGEKMLNDLARDVVNGRIRLPGDDGESLLDRAWRGILDTLRQFTGQFGTPAAPNRGARP